MKPGIPLASTSSFSPPNALMHVGSNPAMISYAPNYFGNQAIATPGFIANNFPVAHMHPPVIEPAGGRRKSLIENINPFVGGEKNILSADMLSAFPVRDFSILC